MRSLSSLIVIMLATLTLGAATGAFAVWLLWLLPTNLWRGDVERPSAKVEGTLHERMAVCSAARKALDGPAWECQIYVPKLR